MKNNKKNKKKLYNRIRNKLISQISLINLSNNIILLCILFYTYKILSIQKNYKEAELFVNFFRLYTRKTPNIAFITAVLGSYESTSKNIVEQTVPFKKFLFSDNFL